MLRLSIPVLELYEGGGGGNSRMKPYKIFVWS